MSLTAEQILAADDRPIVEVRVPEWGGVVCLRPMDGAEYLAFQRYMAAAGEEVPQDFMIRLVIACACDAAGKRLFDEKAAKKLARKNGAALRRLFEEAQSLNLLGGPAAADFPEDSEPTPGAASGSGSPPTAATATPT